MLFLCKIVIELMWPLVDSSVVKLLFNHFSRVFSFADLNLN